MASQTQPAKVLRIGIIQDGKIVRERLIKPGESVKVGESARNTFVFPKTSLPRAEFPLGGRLDEVGVEQFAVHFVQQGLGFHVHAD